MIANILFALAFIYLSPVHYDISLAGNFGEPRHNHFHGGIDVKTGGVEKKPLFSIADGYVSSVSVGIGGYGNALYIKHPDGHTSMYCHLRAFAPRISHVLRKHQYEQKSENGVFSFLPNEVPVSRGDLIAVSGNTGASTAPHLHMEIHDTYRNCMLDPLSFIGEYVKDNYAPLGHCFMAIPVKGEGSFCRGYAKQTFNFSNLTPSHRFSAWGKVGFAIWANDYMEITYNRYGIKCTELYVDDKLYFKSDITSIPIYANMQVNAWGDYEVYMRNKTWYMHSFVKDGMTMPVFYTRAGTKGIVNFNEQREYHIKYVLSDFRGNRKEYSFIVKGEPFVMAAKDKYKPLSSVQSNKPLQLRLPGLLLTSGYNCDADVKVLTPTVKKTAQGLSDAYTFNQSPAELLKYASISIQLKKKVGDTSKLYITCKNGNNKYLGGTYSNGWVTGTMRNLSDSYMIDIDNDAPDVAYVNQAAWNVSHDVMVRVSDKDSGVRNARMTLDGHFVLLQNVGKTQMMHCNLKECPVQPTGKNRKLKITVTDNCNNVKEVSANVLW